MTILTVDWLAREALLILQNNLVPTMLTDREYEGSFTGTEKRGDTVRVRRRDRGNAQEFTGTISKRQLEEAKVDLKLERHVDASFEVTSREMTLDLESFASQILEPQVVSIAEDIDAYVAGKYWDLPSFANVDASNVAQGLPTAIGDLATARKVLNKQKVPMAGRVAVWDPELEAAWLSVNTFVEADRRGDAGTALREASLGRVLGIDHYMGQNVAGDTPLVSPAAADVAGTSSSGPYVVGATSIEISALQASTTFVKGTPLTINHLAVDGGPKTYILAADMTTSAGGVGTAVLYDPTTNGLITGEVLKAPVADGTVVTLDVATAGDSYYRRGALFHPRAFAFASVPLELPPSVEAAVISDSGLSLRVVRDYDIDTKKTIVSIDALVGCKMVHGELGAQWVSSA